jgi:hypothetical protein
MKLLVNIVTKDMDESSSLQWAQVGSPQPCLPTIKLVLQYLKGLSHEIFRLVFWPVWMYLGLNVNRLWFLNF